MNHREDLFARRNPRESSYTQRQGHGNPLYGASSSSSSYGQNGSSPPPSDSNNKDHEAISMDGYYSNENDRLFRSHREIDDMLSQGGEVMGQLKYQRNMLKSTQTRILDITSTLGMSNTVMRFIEQRTKKDKIILVGGIIFITLIMFGTWKYLL